MEGEMNRVKDGVVETVTVTEAGMQWLLWGEPPRPHIVNVLVPKAVLELT